MSYPTALRIPSEAECIHRLAKRDVTTMLQNCDLKVPSGTEVITFSDGQMLTMEDMIARRIARRAIQYHERYTREAAAEARLIDLRARKGV